MKQKVIENFGGKEVNPAAGSAFEPYLDTYTRASFKLNPAESIDSVEYQQNLKDYSSYLANTRVIDVRENGGYYKRHLTHAEYERVSYAREQNGTGKLFPYKDVKVFENTPMADEETVRNIVNGFTSKDKGIFLEF